MVTGEKSIHNSSWRVILRAEQFVWHNKEFPATSFKAKSLENGLFLPSFLINAVIFLHGADRSESMEI